MEYHKTKDILHVMQILGHRSINNTLVYTHLVDFKDDDYTAKIAHSEQEVCQLIEAGFDFVCDYEGNKVFRKARALREIVKTGWVHLWRAGWDLNPRPPT